MQELDWKLSESEKALGEIRTRLADESELISARENLDAVALLLTDLSSRQRTVDRRISGLQERLESIEKKMYGGAVTRPKVMEAAQEEKVFVEGQRQEAEDALLDVMVEMEEAEESKADAHANLRRLEEVRPADVIRLTSDEGSINVDIEQLRGERDRLVPRIPGAIMSRYESLLRTKGGRAVAKVEGGMCQGCRITLPTLELQKARISTDLVQCNSCSRILYVV